MHTKLQQNLFDNFTMRNFNGKFLFYLHSPQRHPIDTCFDMYWMEMTMSLAVGCSNAIVNIRFWDNEQFSFVNCVIWSDFMWRTTTNWTMRTKEKKNVSQIFIALFKLLSAWFLLKLSSFNTKTFWVNAFLYLWATYTLNDDVALTV